MFRFKERADENQLAYLAFSSLKELRKQIATARAQGFSMLDEDYLDEVKSLQRNAIRLATHVKKPKARMSV